MDAAWGLPGPIRSESMPQQLYQMEPPPSYAESLNHRVVPSAPPLFGAPPSPSNSPITRSHTVDDVSGQTPQSAFFASENNLFEMQSTPNIPAVTYGRPRQEGMRSASDMHLYKRRRDVSRRRQTNEPSRMCTRHRSRPLYHSDGAILEEDDDKRTPKTHSKRSKKRKVLDRVALGSWLILWPIYLPYTLIREHPTDEDDFYDDILLSEAYRISKKISPNNADCPECQRME